MRDDIAIVPATAKLALAWYGGQPPYTMRGLVAVEGEQPVAIFGVYWIDGIAVAFSEWKPDLDHRTIVRCFRRGEALLRSIGGTIYAACDKDPAPALLGRLGFVPTGDEALGGTLLVRT